MSAPSTAELGYRTQNPVTGDVIERFETATDGEVTDAQEPYLDFFLERYADAYRIELSAFIEAVEAGTTPPTGIGDAIAALRLAEAATESAHSGQPVRLS